MTERQRAMVSGLPVITMVLAMPGVYRHAPIWVFAAYLLVVALIVAIWVRLLWLLRRRSVDRCPVCNGVVRLTVSDDARCADCGAGLRIDIRSQLRWVALLAVSAWLLMVGGFLWRWLPALGIAGVFAAVVGAALDRSCKWRAH